MEVLIPMADLIDKEAELTRLGKEIGKLENEVERTRNKLSNANFVDKAPAAVVEKEKRKLEEARSALKRLAEQAEKIRGL